MTVLEQLFSGLPLWIQVLFWVVLAIEIAGFASVVVLLVNARRFRARVRRLGEADESEFLWVFLVPALNEEVTIADSVARLAETRATHAVFLVIDDGSQDRTGDILAGIGDPRLRVLTRVAPEARRGKAEALNAAYRVLREDILEEPRFSGWSHERVVVAIVDADGRLDPMAPHRVARHFRDPGVGGVQVLVRIYNRHSWLTWAQDVEFASFGLVFQAGRAWWGVANMGGNGQFNRLAALADVDAGRGPWRDRLTEDQDLGVRLIQSGWAGVQDNSTTIDQQGLNSLRRLYRQRTRWAQGNWQALGLLRGVWRPRLPFLGRVDTIFYLITPPIQLLTGFAFVTSIALALFGGIRYSPALWWVLIFFFAISFGPGFAVLILRGGRWYSPFVALLQLLPYTIYAWSTFPVLGIALVRQLSGRRSWVKTPREALAASRPEPPSALP